MTFTKYVGEVGVEGTRIVRPGGIIFFNTMKFQHDRLLLFEGKEVFCWDVDGDIYVSTLEYPLYSTIRKIPKPHAGKLIVLLDDKHCTFRPSPN